MLMITLVIDKDLIIAKKGFIIRKQDGFFKSNAASLKEPQLQKKVH